MVQQVCLAYARGITTQMAGSRRLLTSFVLRRLNYRSLLPAPAECIDVFIQETMTGIRVGLGTSACAVLYQFRSAIETPKTVRSGVSIS